MPLKPGTTLPGSIVVRRLLSVNETGGIWDAIDVEQKRDVAIKLASRDALDDDPALFERFRLESRTIGEIDNPHVVRIFGDGETEDGIPYLVMERLRGEPLHARLERGALSVADVDRYVSQIGAGLSAVHALGVVHRNVNPETIFLVAPGGDAKLIDFGFAKATAKSGEKPKRLTRHGRLIGSSAYVCPERASAKALSTHSDLWSLAVVAYEMLTQHLPFPGPKLAEQLIQIIHAQYQPPTSLLPGLPVEIDAWFERCLARNKSDRYPSARHMASAFSLAMSSALEW